MTTDAIAASRKRDAARDKSVAALEELFGTSFEIWIRHAGSRWTLESSTARDDTSNLACSSQRDTLLEEVQACGLPCTAQACPGQHWLALPLEAADGDSRTCALARFEISSPHLLLQLAKGELRERQLRTDLDQLREQNDLFLKQVCEDFEELTFLRSMAEQLALEDCSHDLSALIESMLPQLGEAASVESIYYFDSNSDASPQVRHQWLANKALGSNPDHGQLELIVQRFGQQSLLQPVVQNRVQETDWATRLPDIREFILVAATTVMGPQGWLLAVNRHRPAALAVDSAQWSLDQSEFGTPEASLINTAATMLASHAHNITFLEERENLLVSVVRTLVSAVESKDTYTCGHSERVALYGKRLAAEVGYDREACERLYLTGLLHDIGKIGVSDVVLKKKGTLTPEEFAEIQKHPDLGWAILRELKQLSYVLPGVLHHHERVDGQGYPDQLEHYEIPQDSQVLAVVDAFDAMTSDRPYRKSMSLEKAVEIFQEGRRFSVEHENSRCLP